MHNKLTKEQRQNAMEKFRSGKINILVSSDISARGLGHRRCYPYNQPGFPCKFLRISA